MPSPIFAPSPYPHAAANLVLSVHSFFPFHCLSRALRPLLTLSFIFSPPLFPFLSASQVRGSWAWPGCDAGCGWAAVVFVDHRSLRWFMVGLYDGSMSGFCDLISVSLILVILIDFGGFLTCDFGGFLICDL